MQNWINSPSHQAWLARHADDLLVFGRRTPREEGGAHWLDDDGGPDRSRPHYTWITTRTVHVYGVGALLGVPGAAPKAAAALAGLSGALHDAEHGGWFTAVDNGDPASGKSCYDHAFVMLAGATATQAAIEGGRELLDDAIRVFLGRFWDEEAERCVDTWDTAFQELDRYRGLNANMHAVEAMLSVASLTGDGEWIHRARQVSRFVVEQAASNHWRIPEHYDDAWRPVLDFNRDRPADQFKPYGATVGHAFEWARLLCHLANAPGVDDGPTLVDGAQRLFARAVADGWAPDGAPGFVYTTDWDGAPVVRDRLWWVLAEAIAAAAVLHRQTGENGYADRYRHWWDHAATHHIDPVDGSWQHQLDDRNRPATTVWAGKPDLYHVFQTALIPRLPLYPMLAAALATTPS